MLYQERPCTVVRGLTLTAFDIDTLIDESDCKLFRQPLSQVTVFAIFSLLKPLLQILPAL